MISEESIKRIIDEVIASLPPSQEGKKEHLGKNEPQVITLPQAGEKTQGGEVESSRKESEEPFDITSIDLREELLVPNPHNKEVYLKLKSTTPARIGIWRSGARPLTTSLVRFRADHAIAQDAVFSYVSEEFLQKMGWPIIESRCSDKDEFLTRPDLGRQLSDEQATLVREKCPKGARVQFIIADGLSSTAIEVNSADTYQSIAQGLKGFSITYGEPMFVKHGRVPMMDTISEILEPEMTVLLIGERPGLATGESMSCYMSYKASSAQPESHRTVVSNIHKGGTNAVEAGAHIAGVIKTILEQKTSGIELKL